MIHRIYLPHVSAPPPDPRRGLCMTHWAPGDMDLLRCSWWYSWSDTTGIADDRFVPMSTDGSCSLSLPLAYAGYLLVLNEPESMVQANLTPQEGAERVLAIAEKFHWAKLIVGGTGRWAGDWMARFNTGLGDYRPTGYHIHYYIESDATTIQDFRDYVNMYRDGLEGELWLSEFGDTVGDGIALMQAVRESQVDRYAWFANRLTMEESWWPVNWKINMSLVDKDGVLTGYGRAYVGEAA